jgi:hypothetical protein
MAKLFLTLRIQRRQQGRSRVFGFTIGLHWRILDRYAPDPLQAGRMRQPSIEAMLRTREFHKPLN